MSFPSSALRARRAFTLIELLVVILIVAILIAVALPAFLGQTSKAQDSAVMQRLATARIEAKALWTSNGQSGYPALTQSVGQLNRSEPGFQFVADPFIGEVNTNGQGTGSDLAAGSASQIGTYIGPGQNTITFCEGSQSGTVFCLRADESDQLLAVSGTQTTAAPATSAFAPASASADGGYTDVIRSSGTSEGAAVCVLNAATPAAGGTGDWFSCAGGQPGWVTASATAAANGSLLPANTVAPAIGGTAWVGSTLTGSAGTWSNTTQSSTYQYQWEDCNSLGQACTAILGANQATYTLTSADDGHTVVLAVPATNSAGTGQPAQSDPTAVVIGTPANTAAPAISPTTAYVGQPLSASHGNWTDSPTSYSYQWQDCNAAGTSCTNITGANQATYTPVAADDGDSIVVEVSAANAASTSSWASSQPTSAVINTPHNTQAPAVSGTPTVGQTLTASTGSWSDSPTAYSYQWQDCSGGTCTNISGATASTYTVASSDIGSHLVVAVTATNALGSATASSAPSAAASTPATSYDSLVSSYGASHVWKFNETGGSVAHDSVGNINLTGVGSYAMNQTGPFAGATAAQLNDPTWTAANSGQFLSASGSYTTDTENFTMIVWLKYNGANPQYTTNGFETLPFGEEASDGSGWYIHTDHWSDGTADDGQLYSRSDDNTNGVKYADSTDGAVLSPGYWYMVTFERIGNSNYVCVDGGTNCSNNNNGLGNTANLDPAIESSTRMGIGGLPGSQGINGWVSEASYYPSALTTAQITNLYNAG